MKLIYGKFASQKILWRFLQKTELLEKSHTKPEQARTSQKKKTPSLRAILIDIQ